MRGRQAEAVAHYGPAAGPLLVAAAIERLLVVGRAAVWVTIVATAMFVAFYANYVFGWITADMLDWVGVPKV